MKKVLLPVIQVLVTAGLLWWIFRDPARNAKMLGALREAETLWLLPGFLAVGGAFLLQTLRWKILLGVQGIGMGYARALRLMMIGAFFNLFLLGSTGGDVVKIFYAMREAGRRGSAAFLSVVVDRIVGLLALVAVTLVLCAWNFRELTARPVTGALLGTIAVVLGGSLAMVAAGVVVDRFHLAHRLPKRMPFHNALVELAAAFSVYARDLRALAVTFALSVPAHLLIFSSFYFSARAFSAGLGLMDVFGVMPIVSTISSLPISLSGVGVREQLFQELFGALYGTPADVAVLVSLGGFALTMAWGLVGGVVYLFYRPSGVRFGDIRREVAAEEEEIDRA